MAAIVAHPNTTAGALLRRRQEMGFPRLKKPLQKRFTEGQVLQSSSSTPGSSIRDKKGDPILRMNSPTETLFLNLNESGLPDGLFDDVAYTPRESRQLSPVHQQTPRRKMSRRMSNRRDTKRLSQLSDELGLTARRSLTSSCDSVFESPSKPILKKRGSKVLRRKSSFGGYTAPNSPPVNVRRPLKKTVSFGNFTSRSSVSDDPLNASARLSSIANDDSEEELIGKNRRSGRRVSMLTSLRAELMQRDKVNVKRYNETQLINRVKNMSAKRERSEELYREKQNKDHFASITHRTSMPSLFGSRSDSVDSGTLISSYDIKKFEMLQSLEKMGVDLKKIRASRDCINEESKILRQAAEKQRHGSLTSRAIISNFGKPVTLSSPRNKIESLDPATREKLQRVYDQMLKPDAKMVALPGLIGRNRHSVTNDEIASDALSVLRRRLRKKKRPPNRFKRLARFIMVLLRLWGHHASRVNEFLELLQTVDIEEKDTKKDLLFDITEFKAEKEAHVPMEAKRILRKRPNERTDDEVHYLQIALRNYKSLAEYPVHMQRRIAERAWIEEFGAKRVIVREGHVPMCFYFVMSGSAVVSVMDLEKGLAKTVLYYGRGDSFGELAIMNATRRQSTVISKEAIELLVLTDEDFIEIFMSGGLKDPNDPFLCSLPYLDGWPIEKLNENPKKAQFCYYKRGAILVNDSKANDWIVIVKSGSCNLLIKLKHIDPTKHGRKDKGTKVREFRETLLEDFNADGLLSHQERLAVSLESELKQLESQNQLTRFYALPEIFIEPNDSYKELKRFHAEHSEHVGLSIAEKLRESDVMSRNPTTTSIDRQLTGSGLGSLVKKGPYMIKSKTNDSQTDMLKDKSRMGTTFSDFLRENATSTSAQEMLREQKKTDPPPMYVNVQTLTKGMVFGLSDIFFEDQPSLVLVSNGAECITISKKLYMDQASHAFVTRLREDIYPYPSEEDLQQNLELQVYWDHHRRHEIGHVMKDINFKRSEVHDCRARHTPDLNY